MRLCNNILKHLINCVTLSDQKDLETFEIMSGRFLRIGLATNEVHSRTLQTETNSCEFLLSLFSGWFVNIKLKSYDESKFHWIAYYYYINKRLILFYHSA